MPFPNPETQFKPGQSGNPKGRPRSLTSLLRDALEREEAPGKTVADRLVEVLLGVALDGDRQAIKDVFDRADGKAKETIEIKAKRSDVKQLFWPDAVSDRNADAPPGPAGGAGEPGEVQGSGVRPEVGEDPPGLGDLP